LLISCDRLSWLPDSF